jgi:hypothetical protein
MTALTSSMADIWLTRQFQYALGLISTDLRFAAVHGEKKVFGIMLEQSIRSPLKKREFRGPW